MTEVTISFGGSLTIDANDLLLLDLDDNEVKTAQSLLDEGKDIMGGDYMLDSFADAYRDSNDGCDELSIDEVCSD